MKVLLAVPAALAFAAACQQRPLPTDLDQPTEAAKTDDLGAVERQAIDEPLLSAALVRLVCDAIGAPAEGAACDDVQTTVVEIATSTLYAHQDDGRAITMQLVVQSELPSGESYESTLTREVDSRFRMRFAAQLIASTLDKDHARIRELADFIGEYFDHTDPAVADNFRVVSLANLPAALRDNFDRRVEVRAEENASQNGGAEYTDPAVLEIIFDGLVIGYVLGISDFIDHPLWDGSGVNAYYDAAGTLLLNVEWSG